MAFTLWLISSQLELVFCFTAETKVAAPLAAAAVGGGASPVRTRKTKVDLDSDDSAADPRTPMMMDAKISPQSDGLAIGNNRGYKPLFIVSQTIVFILFLLLLTLIFKYLGGFGFEVASVFNFHPMFMMLGFIILYSNCKFLEQWYFLLKFPPLSLSLTAILIYRTFRYELKQKLKLAHTILNGAAIVVSMFGSLSVFYYHQKANIPHFYSLHSWLGISTWLLFVSQFTSGFVTFLYPGASYTMRSLLMPLHRYSGIATFVLAAATCLTGLNEKAIFALKE